MDRISRTVSHRVASMIPVAPRRPASSRRAALVSTATIRSAPASAHPCTMLRPTPPQPSTATLLPAAPFARKSAAPTPVATELPTRAARSDRLDHARSLVAADHRHRMARRARHDMMSGPADTGGGHPHTHLVGARSRQRHLFDREWLAGSVEDRRLHGRESAGTPIETG